MEQKKDIESKFEPWVKIKHKCLFCKQYFEGDVCDCGIPLTRREPQKFYSDWNMPDDESEE